MRNTVEKNMFLTPKTNKQWASSKAKENVQKSEPSFEEAIKTTAIVFSSLHLAEANILKAYS